MQGRRRLSKAIANVASFARAGLGDVRSVLVASDPALTRLRMAMRVTLTLVSVGLALVCIHAFLSLPVAAYGVAVITAMQGALAIRDATPRSRAVTRLYGGVAGFAAVAMAALLGGSTLGDKAVFLALVFVVVYVRKYGQRWNAVGMFAFMCYFMGSYLRPALADLPGIALAIAVSGLLSHLVRNVVLPENRKVDFGLAILAIDGRLSDLVQLLAIGRGNPLPEAGRRRTIRALERVTEAVLIAEGFLPLAEIDDSPERRPVASLAIALFDLHLASETAVAIALREASAESGNERGAALDAALGRIEKARRLVQEAAGALGSGDFDGSTAEEKPAAPDMASSALEDPALRLAVQVTLASAIAMTGGLFLSTTRWFWATLTAFLVFTNTQSRGDTALRGINRAAGTLAGIAVGIGLATLLAGAVLQSLVLSVLFVFAGFYFLQVSYAAMTFFVTLVVSLLYGLLGEFTPGLLVLRLEETLIGAAAGIFIAFVVFPRSTSSTANGAVGAFLDALDRLLDAANLQLDGKAAPQLTTLSRVLDRRYADLAIVARPLGADWHLVQRPGRVRRTLLRFMGLAHWSHILARNLTAPTRPHAATRIAQLREQLTQARDAGAGLIATVDPGLAAAGGPEPLRAHFDTRSDDPEFALDVLAHILDRIAHGDRRVGLPPATANRKPT